MSEGVGGGPEVGWQVAVLVDDVAAVEEVVLQDSHRYYRIEYKTNEVREGGVRDAIGCPWTVMIHFWNTAVTD